MIYIKTKLDNRSKYLRKIIVDCLSIERRGHIGSSMSIVEILRVLYDDILKFNSKKINLHDRDRFILSKGHGCLALYSILFDKGFLNKKQLMDIGSIKSILGGHPEHTIPGVEVSTGALGHGYPFAVGMAIAAKIKKKKHKIYVLLGDGEINEGSIWESALGASKHKLDNLITLIDYNKLQSYGLVKEIFNLEPLKDKWKSFGFNVLEVDGHNITKIKKMIKKTSIVKNKPTVIICHTIKGKGLGFAEGKSNWHHKSSITNDEIKMMYNELK